MTNLHQTLVPHKTIAKSDQDGTVEPLTRREMVITTVFTLLVLAPIIAIPLSRPKPTPAQVELEAQIERDREEIRRLVAQLRLEQARVAAARAEVRR